MRASRWSVLCALAAACTTAPALRHTADGRTQADKSRYSIAPLPDGALMPAGWTLQNYADKDGVQQKVDRGDPRDLSFGRADDGFLFIATKHISTMGKRTLASLLHDFIARHLEEQKRTMDAESSAGAPRAIEGGEGFALTVEVRQSARDQQPLSRIYYLCFWPPSHDEMSVLVYANTQAGFERALPDVNGLIARIAYR